MTELDIHTLIVKELTKWPIKAYVYGLEEFRDVKLSGNEVSDIAHVISKEIYRQIKANKRD